MEDLAEKVNEVAAKLELESASTPTEKLEILKAFCLEISRHSLATSFSIQDTSPENPYQEYGP
jgi:hypothetical protein